MSRAAYNSDCKIKIMNGFETNVRLDNFNNVSPLQIHISFYATDEQKRAMADELRRASYKFFNFQFTAYGLMLDRETPRARRR